MLLPLLLSASLQAGSVAQTVRGDVVLNCEVRADGDLGYCHVVSETPAGRGFAAAAARQWPFVKAKGLRPGRQDVPFAIRMTPEEADRAGIVPPHSPPLVQLGPHQFREFHPSWKEVEAFAPPKARRHAGAAVQCTVQPDGRLGACRVLEADEPKYGVAAVRAAEALYRAPLQDAFGPTTGRPYNIEIAWGRPGPPGPNGRCPRNFPNCPFGTSSRR